MAHASVRQLNFPVGAKYVLERVGPFVRRYVELPNGSIIQLPTRKARTCGRAILQTRIVPEHTADAFNMQTGRRPIVA